MSKGGWFPTVVLGLILLAILGGGFYYGSELAHDYANDRNQISANEDRRIKDSLDACASIVVPLDALQCRIKAISAIKEAETSEKDLKAQQQMSVWAFGVLVLSLAAFVLTFAGLIFVVLTYRETAKGVDVMRSEQRPWLDFQAFQRCDFWQDDNGVWLLLAYKVLNRGHRPATDLRIDMSLEPWPDPFDKNLLHINASRSAKEFVANVASGKRGSEPGTGTVLFGGEAIVDHKLTSRKTSFQAKGMILVVYLSYDAGLKNRGVDIHFYQITQNNVTNIGPMKDYAYDIDFVRVIE